MGFLLAGVGSLIACIAIGPIMSRRLAAYSTLVVRFGLGDGGGSSSAQPSTGLSRTASAASSRRGRGGNGPAGCGTRRPGGLAARRQQAAERSNQKVENGQTERSK